MDVWGQAREAARPEKRFYPVERQPTSEAGIHTTLLRDLYVVLGDELKNGAYSIRVYFNPLVRLIWIGGLVMFFGGAVSLSDRRLRVGAPERAKPKSNAATATAGK